MLLRCPEGTRLLVPPGPALLRDHLRAFALRLDADLARLYGVPTKRFNEAFKRNRHRFPEDFAFQLTREETLNLRSQFATSSLDLHPNQDIESNWSQSVTSSQSHGGLRYRPWAFTEHGALMAANILRSERAAEMSVYVVRAFVKQREALATNAVILKRLADGARQRGEGVVQRSETARALWARVHRCGCLLRAA